MTPAARRSDRALRTTATGGAAVLSDQVSSYLERIAAVRTLQRVREVPEPGAVPAVTPPVGVTAVRDALRAQPPSDADDVGGRVTAALLRDTGLDTGRVHVEVSGSGVVLTGAVASWGEHHEAGRAASATPGATRVQNHLLVRG